MLKNRILYPTIALTFLSVGLLHAQFPYSETFKNSTAPGLVVSGAAKLTAASGIDAAGQGYLRLTEDAGNSVGYVYAQNAFPSGYGISATFEFFTWKTGATGSNQADGICFFLFDASVNSFRPGGVGGSLGYANYYGTPGMAKGYIGVGIDEFGNFSLATDGNKNGGSGQKDPSAVVVRGPGNSAYNSLGATDYVYKANAVTTKPAFNIPFSGSGFNQRFPDPTSANYRKLKIILTPGSTLGTAGYTLTVIMYKGGTTLTPVTLINNLDYPYMAPAKLKFGLIASTGGVTTYHEIRNMAIEATNTTALAAPTLTNDAVTITCQGQQALLDVTANDASNNSGGSLNKTTVDLDPTTSGQQTSFTDAGKGTYTVDAAGIVTFTPVSGYVGVSSISYLATDTYGIAATTAATISVTVNATTGPSLTIINPSAVCAPLKVDITNASYKSSTTAGATYDYFSSLTDANNNTNNINSTANTIGASGTYYIRALYNSCPTVKPIVVQVDAAPTTASINNGNQSFCSFAGSPATQTATLLGNNPDVGTGTWSLVSGPTTATLAYPNAATSPLLIADKGVYVYKWTISNGACTASSSTVQLSAGTITSTAGSNQVLCNGTSTTLQGNTPSLGTGLWTKSSGPALTISTASSPTTSITGLTPGSSYVLDWKISNGTCTSTSQVTITSYAASVANAGSNQTISNATTATLNATAPATGSGTWTQTSGPAATISTPSSASSTVTGLVPGNTYTFRWTVTDNSCVSTSDVTITDVLNTIADAGPDQVLGSVNQFSLSANTPGAGNSGLWSLRSAPTGSTATITNTTQPQTTVTAINKIGDYTFRWTVSNGTVSNFDDVTLSVVSVLPVRFLSFSGTPQNNIVLLRWETAAEINNHHFNIERSTDGRSFTKVGDVPATDQHQYNFTDNVKTVAATTIFYRLQQVDNNGQSMYSSIIKVALDKPAAASAWPNPFHTRFYIGASFTAPGTAQVVLYDQVGRMLQTTRQSVVKGYNVLVVDRPQAVQPQILYVEVVKDGFRVRQKLAQE